MGKQVYSREFKDAAVEQVIGQRHTIGSVAKRLGVNYHTLREWVQAARSAAPASTVSADLPLDQRVRELEKENARLRMERDILKKATAYFAKLESEERS
ncbi:MAG: transposase [Phycisphaerae bacterium]|jgi:transposase